jgi:hypothetical protein
MAKTTACGNALLLLLFNNTDWANIGDAAGLQNAATAGVLYFSLHTSDPGVAGNQTTNEISYTGYARQAVARSGAGFTVTNNAVALAALIAFGAMSGGDGGTVTHYGLGTAETGAGHLLYSGTVTPNVLVTTPTNPQLAAGTILTES